jgi:hypothetical protein
MYINADGTQMFGLCSLATAQRLATHVSSCIDEVVLWMHSNWLQLNTAETEVIWDASARRQHQLLTVSVRIGTNVVVPVHSIRDFVILVVYLNAVAKTGFAADLLRCPSARSAASDTQSLDHYYCY